VRLDDFEVRSHDALRFLCIHAMPLNAGRPFRPR
jgi:hypothetical protein